MKIILFIFLLVNSSSFGQDIYEKIAEETCGCTSKIDFKKEDANFDMQFGLCILQAYNSHINEIAENERLDFSDKEQMKNFGRDIGLKMIKYCPDSIMNFGNIALADEEEEVDSFFEIEGIFTGTKLGSFLNIQIVEPNGKTNNFIILQNFDNAFLITDKVLKNKDVVTVIYYTIDLFDHKLNRFVSTNILTDITKN